MQVANVAPQFLLVILVIGGVASALIIGLSIMALVRRRSWSYFLVTLALSTLLVRTLIGMVSLGGTMDPTAHHVLEHGMDVLTAIFLIGAIATARRVDPSSDIST